jgi:hypothetical protein
MVCFFAILVLGVFAQAAPTGWLADLSAIMIVNRFAFEIAAFVLVSFGIGFLIARAMYRGQVRARTELLRAASATWRRRMAHGATRQLSLTQQRDRSNRQLRRTRHGDA